MDKRSYHACKKKDPEFKAEVLSLTSRKLLDVTESSDVIKLLTKILKRQPSGAP